MKKSFLTGLAILLPVALTIAIVGSLINFFTGPFVAAVSTFIKKYCVAQNGFLFLTQDQIITYLSKILILIFLLIVILLLGILTRWIFIRSIFGIGDRILKKIPVFSSVYKTTQEIIRNLFTVEKTAFKKVVLVPFPSKDMYTIGLVSGGAPESCTETLHASLVSVLILTTPNPTTGYILLYKAEDVIYLDMKPEDAIKYIISCGVLIPQDRRIV